MRLHFVSTLVLVCLAAGVALARGGDIVCRARVFAVSKELASSLLDDPKLGADASGLLSKLQQFVTSNQAEVVANPTVRTPVATRAAVKGLVSFQMETTQAEAGRLKLLIVLGQGEGEQRTSITTGTELELGKPKFLGTLEPRGASEKNRTWLVFMHVQ